MKRLTHELWDPPPESAPELQKQAHRLMVQTLMRIQPRVPEVLRSPELAGGSRVMSAAIAALLNPKIDKDLRLAALSQLQKRMTSVDRTTPQRLFLSRPEYHSTIATSLGDDLAGLAGFDEAFEEFILKVRPGRLLRASAAKNNEKCPYRPTLALKACGLLVAMLVTRLGHTSPATLGCALQLLVRQARASDPTECEGKVLVAGQWTWVDLELTAAGTPQVRRLFLDPTALAAWLTAHALAPSLPLPPSSYKVGQRAKYYRSLARQAFGALVSWMADRGIKSPITRLDDLCRGQDQRLRMVTMPLIATYAQGGFASSALDSDTWCRLIGYLPAPERESVKVEGAPAPIPELRGIDFGGASDFSEQIAAGDLEESGLVVELREVMNRPRSEWRGEFRAIVERLRASDAANETARFAVQWLDFIAFKRTNKTKYLSDASVRHYRGLLVNRLLELLPPKISDLSSEDLKDAYSEVILSRRSLAQTRHLLAALISFDRCIRQEKLAELPTVELPGFSGAGYAISSRIIVESEFLRGLEMVDSGTLQVVSDELKMQLKVFWILAFRFGLRRSEIMGLQVRDFDGRVLRVRVNEARGLKTGNAYRLVPLHTLLPEERAIVDELLRGKHDDDYVFFNDGAPNRAAFESHPVIAKVNALLERTTGDDRLHPHNLRHSFPTLHILGTLGSDILLHEHSYCEPWMEAAITQGRRIDTAISGFLHRKAWRGAATAMMLGHGSELTTYEHYVHSFDLLLFLSCWSGRFARQRQHWARYLIPERDEKGQLLAMVGGSAIAVSKFNKPAAVVDLVASIRPVAVTKLLPRSSLQPSAPSQAAMPTIRLEQLLNRPGAAAERGYPTLQAELDVASAQLQLFDQARQRDSALLGAVLRRWIDARRDEDWSSMAPSDARKWVSEVVALMPGVYLQAQHWTKTKDRKTDTSKIVSISSPEQLDREDGHYLLRFGERPKRKDSRPRKTGSNRSRSQSSITWLVIAFETLL